MGHHENDARDEQRERQREETVAKRTHTLEEGPVWCVVCTPNDICMYTIPLSN